MPSPDSDVKACEEIQKIQKLITEINAEYAYLSGVSDRETDRVS